MIGGRSVAGVAVAIDWVVAHNVGERFGGPRTAVSALFVLIVH